MPSWEMEKELYLQSRVGVARVQHYDFTRKKCRAQAQLEPRAHPRQLLSRSLTGLALPGPRYRVPSLFSQNRIKWAQLKRFYITSSQGSSKGLVWFQEPLLPHIRLSTLPFQTNVQDSRGCQNGSSSGRIGHALQFLLLQVR